MYPHSTFGTIVLLEEAGPSLSLAILSSLSISYVLIGLICFIGARTPQPHNIWIAAVMIIRHGWTGIAGIQGAGSDWIIGNPWHDVIIHSIFIFFYLLAIYLSTHKVK